jgi:tRNA(Ile)-lysidine synthase
MGPDPAVAAVRRAVRCAVGDLPGPLLVACSGGADSMALAAGVAFEAVRAGRAAGLITVDHRLQKGSASRAASVSAVAYELGFDPVQVVPVDVAGVGGPEAAARTARYRALDAAAAAVDGWLLLGHTLDDQAETVLLGLGRGSGPRSIAGMQPCDGRRVRPLLGVRRADTVRACSALGLPVWSDPHNVDPRYQRARIRGEVLPLLEDVLQGGVAEALARTADLMRDDLAALDALAEQAYHHRPSQPSGALSAEWRDTSRHSAENAPLDVGQLTELPRAIRTRILRTWAAARGAGPLAAVHLAALDALVVTWHGQGPVELPGGVRVSRRSGTLVATSPPDSPPGEPA